MSGASPPFPRIVHVASGRQWRGGERQVLLLASHLKDLGASQVVVTHGAGRLASELGARGLAVKSVTWHGGLDPRALPALVAEGRQGPTLFHAHDAHAVHLAGFASWLTRQPLVATRRLDTVTPLGGFWRRAARIIAISEAVQRSLEAAGVGPDRIALVPSGIDLNDQKPIDPAATRRQLGLPASGPLVATVAALDPSKGVDTVIHAAAILVPKQPELRWAVAGAGPDRERLQALIAHHGLTGTVQLLGQLPDPAPLIRTATLMVHVPLSEALGTVILDALAAGTPVVGSQVGGIPELLGRGAGVLVSPNDPAALGEAVANLLRDENARRSVTNTGLLRVQQFTARGMATKVLDVYRSVVLERW